jgi:hypothetical protein
VSYTSPTNSLTLTQNTQTVSFQNSIVANVNGSVTIGDSKVSLSGSNSYCNFVKASLKNSGVNTTGYNCTSVNVIQKTAVAQVATAGLNGVSFNVGSSQTVSVSFFQSKTAMTVHELTHPFSIWIPRSSNITIPSYQNLTASFAASLQCTYNDYFLQNTVTIQSSSSSIHVQFKPVDSNPNIGYLFLLKFGSAPKLNATYSHYDMWQLYCPSDTTTQLSDTFFLFFANQRQFTGSVGFAIRELTASELALYCPNSVNTYNLATAPVLNSSSASSNSTVNSTYACKLIDYDLNLRIFLSGCYYLNTSTGSYQSDGAVVQADTTIQSTHCLVYHFTEFAGGFVVLPATINFDQLFVGANAAENASIAKNPILYATVFTIIGLYVVLAVFCRIFDMRDRNKKGVTLLNGRSLENLYEIIVFTGNRRNAGTDSNVFMIVSGRDENSHVIALKDKKRKLFRRGGFDTFILSTQR